MEAPVFWFLVSYWLNPGPVNLREPWNIQPRIQISESHDTLDACDIRGRSLQAIYGVRNYIYTCYGLPVREFAEKSETDKLMEALRNMIEKGGK